MDEFARYFQSAIRYSMVSVVAFSSAFFSFTGVALLSLKATAVGSTAVAIGVILFVATLVMYRNAKRQSPR